MDELKTLLVRLRADIGQFTTNLRKATAEVVTFQKMVAASVGKAAFSLMHFATNTMRTVYHSIARYVRLAGLAIAGMGVVAVKWATDVRESMNFFRESFKGLAGDASKWAGEFSRQLFLNRTSVQNYMVTFNEMLQGMGLGREEALELSKGLVKIQYDMASFRNLRIGDSFEKISAALVGMSRPLRDLGYDISETALQEFALSEGITKSVEAMSQAEKVGLRYRLMLKVLANAQGDMWRTINEAANVFRGIWEKITEIGEGVGEVLLKRILEPAKALRDFLSTNQKQIVVYFDTFITNMVNVVNFIRSDFQAAMKLAGTIIIEVMRGAFETVLVLAKTAFVELGTRIPGWIAEGMAAAAAALTGKMSKADEAQIQQDAIKMYESTGGRGQYVSDVRFNGPDGIRQDETRRYQPENEEYFKTMESFVRANKKGGGGQRTLAEESGEIAAIWKERMAAIQKAIEEAKGEGLEIVTPEQIAALHTAEEEMEQLKMDMAGVGEAAKQADNDVQETASKWSEVWSEASGSIRQSMKSAFGSIVTDARNAKDYLLNMIGNIQQTLAEELFDKFVLSQIFGGGGPMGGGGGILGLSGGGMVYAAKGLFRPRGTDTVPAMLTPGEGVLDTETTARLRKILAVPAPVESGRGGNMEVNVTAVDAPSVLALFRRNQKALASVGALNSRTFSAATRGQRRWR